MSKKYVTYDQVHNLVKSQVENISIYNPDIILAIGGGGYIPARILRTWIDNPIIGVGIQLYDKNDNQYKEGPKKIQWLDENSKNIIKGKKILIVDEVDDTRKTINYCINELKKLDIKDIAIFVLHNKLKTKSSLDIQDNNYFAGETLSGDTWIIYPWEADDIHKHNLLSLNN